MLYTAIDDVCKAFKQYTEKLITNRLPTQPTDNSIYNLFYPQPLTILELAETIKEAVTQHTQGKVTPTIKIIDKGSPALFSANEKETLNVDITKTLNLLRIKTLKSPKQKIHEIVKKRRKN